MHDWIKEREDKLRKFFELQPETELLEAGKPAAFDLPARISDHLAQFNLEWHIIPSESAFHIDTDDYRARLYPMLMRELKRP